MAYSISGRITGAIKANVLVSLSGIATTVTNGFGHYTFDNVPNGTYWVAPIMSGVVHTPNSRKVVVSGANVSGVFFSNVSMPGNAFTIAGTITSGGSPLAGVEVFLTGANTGYCITNGAGQYTFSFLEGKQSYTIVPSLAGYRFTPVSRIVTLETTIDQSNDNTLAYGNIDGITHRDALKFNSTGQTLYGVDIGINTAGVSQHFVLELYDTHLVGGIYMPNHLLTTFPEQVSPATAGNYVLHVDTGVRVLPVGVLAIALKPVNAGPPFLQLCGINDPGNPNIYCRASYNGNSWSNHPDDYPYSVLFVGGDLGTEDFTAAISTTYSISGQVTGKVKNGVTMTLSGDASDVTVTAPDGSYSFSGLNNGSYDVTPSLDGGYGFSPVSTHVTIAGGDAFGVNFVDFGLYSISGTVSGATVLGVSIALTGADTEETTTASDGTYSFTGLANGAYVVTPSAAGYTFNPANRAPVIEGESIAGQDFVSSRLAGCCSIERTGYRQTDNAPFVGVSDDPIVYGSYVRRFFAGVINNDTKKSIEFVDRTNFPYWKPTCNSLVSEQVVFLPSGPNYVCTLLNSFDGDLTKCILLRNGIPIPQTWWSFSGINQVVLDAGEYDSTATYEFRYGALIRAEFIVDVSSLDAIPQLYYLPYVDAFVGGNVVEDNVVKIEQVGFDSSGKGTLRFVSNNDLGAVTVTRILGGEQLVLPPSAIQQLDGDQIIINPVYYSNQAYYSVQYTALISGIQKFADYSLEWSYQHVEGSWSPYTVWNGKDFVPSRYYDGMLGNKFVNAIKLRITFKNVVNKDMVSLRAVGIYNLSPYGWDMGG